MTDPILLEIFNFLNIPEFFKISRVSTKFYLALLKADDYYDVKLSVLIDCGLELEEYHVKRDKLKFNFQKVLRQITQNLNTPDHYSLQHVKHQINREWLKRFSPEFEQKINWNTRFRSLRKLEGLARAKKILGKFLRYLSVLPKNSFELVAFRFKMLSLSQNFSIELGGIFPLARELPGPPFAAIEEGLISPYPSEYKGCICDMLWHNCPSCNPFYLDVCCSDEQSKYWPF